MAEFLENMELTIYFMRLEDKYWGVFLVGLFVLFYLQKKEINRLLFLSLLTCVICLCPPIAYFLTDVIKLVPEYYYLFHMIPTGVVVCTVIALIWEQFWDEKRSRFILLAGVFLLLFFAGEFAYTSANRFNNDQTFLGKEEAAVYELMLADMEEQGKEEAYLWGPYKVMADSRIYSAKFLPIYGKDITKEEAGYSPTLLSMYQGYSSFEAPDSNLANKKEQVMAIANCLNVYPEIVCDYVIVQNPKELGADVDPIWIFEELGYVYVGEAESFQVFRRL